MATSDEDLQALQNDVENLRDKIAEENAKRANAEREASNDLTAANLRAEKARLEAELAAAKAANTKTAVKEGASAPMEAAKDDLARANAQLDAATKAAEKPAENDK